MPLEIPDSSVESQKANEILAVSQQSTPDKLAVEPIESVELDNQKSPKIEEFTTVITTETETSIKQMLREGKEQLRKTEEETKLRYRNSLDEYVKNKLFKDPKKLRRQIEELAKQGRTNGCVLSFSRDKSFGLFNWKYEWKYAYPRFGCNDLDEFDVACRYLLSHSWQGLTNSLISKDVTLSLSNNYSSPTDGSRGYYGSLRIYLHVNIEETPEENPEES